MTLEHVQLLTVLCRNLSSFLQFDPDYHITQVGIRYENNRYYHCGEREGGGA